MLNIKTVTMTNPLKIEVKKLYQEILRTAIKWEILTCNENAQLESQYIKQEAKRLFRLNACVNNVEIFWV